MIYTNKILGNTTPYKMIEAYYDRAKEICHNIWDKPKATFEDIYHDTLYKCLSVLGKKEYSQDFLKSYFFKAFRINMIRHFGYAYNRLKSGLEIEHVILPVENEYADRMDGYSMLEYVEKKHGNEIKNMLWDNLQGTKCCDLNKKYNVNTYYYLSKIKDELKNIYIKENVNRK